ncbi:MAG: MucR family transcriptional regulator [Cytophagaceae bacterium]|nr:MAG: MucR family transcriptional regulator [Cytophagaceae bacterium]
MADTVSADVLGLTAQIVAAHIGHNQVAADTLPALIQSVYQSLSTVETQQAELVTTQAPAVPVKKSVFPDFIICLEDGKKLKMLKRHLKTSYNMTPDDYRSKWNLPWDYPMVAPSYASHRSSLAKSSGLGRRRAETDDAQPPVTHVPARRAKGSKG